VLWLIGGDRRHTREAADVSRDGGRVAGDQAPDSKEEAEMRIVVVGGTGLIGRQVAELVRKNGHEVVVAARSEGVDVTTGAGLDQALDGAQAVVDVTNTASTETSAAEDFFATATGQLLEAELRAGIEHHVVLSIAGVDRVPSNPHYAGKLVQERLVSEGPVPSSILRATQFFEFPAMVCEWTREDGTATLPPLLIQPVAAADVAAVLAEIATGPPRGDAGELAGPERQDFVDMARRTLAARGEELRLVPSWDVGPFSTAMAGDVLLPAKDARIATTTFETWLAAGA
jgi:uncharacterized protein YbjT (DUF2867 family)